MTLFRRPQDPSSRTIFLTGASGYVGGRLVPALLARGYSVRCLAREPRKLSERPWRSNPDVSVVAGNMSDQDQLAGQLRGCSVAFNLVHSMEATGGVYAERGELADALTDARSIASRRELSTLYRLLETALKRSSSARDINRLEKVST